MRSLRTRLLAGLSAALAAAIVTVGWITYRNVLHDTQQLFDYQLRQMALTLKAQGGFGGDQAQALTDEGLDFVVQIWTVDGRAIFASRRHEALPSRAVLGFADVSVAGGPTWRTFSTITPDRVIQVAQPLTVRQRLAAEAALRGVLPLVFLAPVLAGAVWWLVALSLRPLRRVAAEVRRRDAGALSPVAVQGVPDEVEPLVGALNALLERLAQSFDAQRSFTADAAHELRSPLTALKLQIELMERAGDDESRRRAMRTLREGVDRASRLVDQLLTLARSERAAAPAAFELLSLHEVVRSVLAAMAPEVTSRHADVELEGLDIDRVRGDAASLEILVRNLVDNAMRYGGGRDGLGARVSVRIERSQDRQGVSLHVDDAGPGIPAGEHDRVFDRFYRRGGSSDAEPGTGLGLAIVRNIAQQHGAAVALSTSPLGGLRVSVTFPAAEPQASAT